MNFGTNGTNGTTKNVLDLSDDDFDIDAPALTGRTVTVESVAEETTATERTLDDIVRFIRAGKRDKKAIDRIVRQYGIANDAGIGDTVIAATAIQVRAYAKNLA